MELWTSGFFNERFPGPVSPLGWSIIRPLVEETAFREPLSFVGYRMAGDLPLTRLYHGRPYANVCVFQMLYRLFPALLVSEDARRLFPGGNVDLRLTVERPPLHRIARAMLCTFLTEPGWHPLNYHTWYRFIRRYDPAVARAQQTIARADDLPALLRAIDTLMALSRDLLRLHRWSLTYAEVCYTLLRRLMTAWFGADQAARLSAALISGLPNRSTEVDIALWQLAHLAASLPATLRSWLEEGDYDAFLAGLDETPAGVRFRRALERFLAAYGHRSPSLDVRYPCYRDDPAQVLAVLAHFMTHVQENPVRREFEAWQRRIAITRRVERYLSSRWLDRLLPVRRAALGLLLRLAQHYVQLREDQRFAWQKSLAAKRKACQQIGERLVDQGVLTSEEDVFFLTLDEIRDYARGAISATVLHERALARRREAQGLESASYPAFLRDDTPLGETSPAATGHQLRGIGVSPGVATGPARVASGPQVLPQLSRQLVGNEILVTVSTDPGWTPLFLRLGGLVMERGGQLSHGAVVAREYGLPAVSGIPGVVRRIRDGQRLIVDGNRGTVTVLENDAEV